MDNISLFPLQKYDQTVSSWIRTEDPDFNLDLLSPKFKKWHLDSFYQRHFGKLSPWNENYILQIITKSAPNDLRSTALRLINKFSSKNQAKGHIGYGKNFRPYSEGWIEAIANNINLSQFEGLKYHNNNRGIAIANLHARILPTEDVHFYNPWQVGQGYPFDNLQIAALWAGTPVYCVAKTQDCAWTLIITPDYIGWVQSNGIASTDNAFINTWISASTDQLSAINKYANCDYR